MKWKKRDQNHAWAKLGMHSSKGGTTLETYKVGDNVS
jgi:hypothetical protein